MSDDYGHLYTDQRTIVGWRNFGSVLIFAKRDTIPMPGQKSYKKFWQDKGFDASCWSVISLQKKEPEKYIFYACPFCTVTKPTYSRICNHVISSHDRLGHDHVCKCGFYTNDRNELVKHRSLSKNCTAHKKTYKIKNEKVVHTKRDNWLHPTLPAEYYWLRPLKLQPKGKAIRTKLILGEKLTSAEKKTLKSIQHSVRIFEDASEDVADAQAWNSFSEKVKAEMSKHSVHSLAIITSDLISKLEACRTWTGLAATAINIVCQHWHLGLEYAYEFGKYIQSMFERANVPITGDPSTFDDHIARPEGFVEDLGESIFRIINAALAVAGFDQGNSFVHGFASKIHAGAVAIRDLTTFGQFFMVVGEELGRFYDKYILGVPINTEVRSQLAKRILELYYELSVVPKAQRDVPWASKMAGAFELVKDYELLKLDATKSEWSSEAAISITLRNAISWIQKEYGSVNSIERQSRTRPEPVGLVLAGPAGTGKTGLMSYISRTLIAHRYNLTDVNEIQSKIYPRPAGERMDGLNENHKIMTKDDAFCAADPLARSLEAVELITLIAPVPWFPQMAELSLKANTHPELIAVLMTSNLILHDGVNIGVTEISALLRRFAKLCVEWKPGVDPAEGRRAIASMAPFTKDTKFDDYVVFKLESWFGMPYNIEVTIEQVIGLIYQRILDSEARCKKELNFTPYAITPLSIDSFATLGPAPLRIGEIFDSKQPYALKVFKQEGYELTPAGLKIIQTTHDYESSAWNHVNIHEVVLSFINSVSHPETYFTNYPTLNDRTSIDPATKKRVDKAFSFGKLSFVPGENGFVLVGDPEGKGKGKGKEPEIPTPHPQVREVFPTPRQPERPDYKPLIGYEAIQIRVPANCEDDFVNRAQSDVVMTYREFVNNPRDSVYIVCELELPLLQLYWFPSFGVMYSQDFSGTHLEAVDRHNDWMMISHGEDVLREHQLHGDKITVPAYGKLRVDPVEYPAPWAKAFATEDIDKARIIYETICHYYGSESDRGSYFFITHGHGKQYNPDWAPDPEESESESEPEPISKDLRTKTTQTYHKLLHGMLNQWFIILYVMASGFAGGFFFGPAWGIAFSVVGWILRYAVYGLGYGSSMLLDLLITYTRWRTSASIRTKAAYVTHVMSYVLIACGTFAAYRGFKYWIVGDVESKYQKDERNERVKKPKASNVEVAKVQGLDFQAHATRVNLFDRNQFILSHKETNALVKTLGIGNGWYLVSRHEWLLLRGLTNVRLINTANTQHVVNVPSEATVLKTDDGHQTEVVAIQLGVACANIVSKFRMVGDYVDGAEYSVIKSGFEISRTGKIVNDVHQLERATLMTDHCVLAYENGEFYKTWGYLEGEGHSARGFCGYVDLVKDRTCARKIAGFHVGNRKGKPISVILYQHMIEAIVNSVPASDLHLVSFVKPEGSIRNIFPNTLPIGELKQKYKPGPIPRSKLKKTGVRGTPLKIPAFKTLETQEGREQAIENHVKKFARIAKCPPDVRTTTTGLTNLCASVWAKSSCKELLPIDIVLNGDSNQDLTAINMNAGKGLPWSRMYPGKGKLPCVQRDENGHFSLSPEFSEHYTKFVGEMLEGKGACELSAMSWKDELLTRENVAKGKVRLYMAGSLHMYILADSLLASFFANLSKHPDAKWFGPGYDMTGCDSHWIICYLHSNDCDQEKIMCFDISGMDVSEHKDLIDAAFGSIRDGYTSCRKNPVFLKLFDAFVSVTGNKTWTFQGFVFFVFGKMASGFRFTAELNTLVLRIIHRYIFGFGYRQRESGGPEEEEQAWNENVRFLGYGDDSVITVRRNTHPWYTPKFVIKTAASQFGMVFTSARKDGSEGYENMETLDYCSHKFRFADGFWRAYRDVDVILDGLYYWRDDGTPKNKAVKDKVVSMLQDLSAHGEEVYNHNMTVINTKLAEAGYDPVVIPYEIHRERYLKTFQ